MNLTYKLLSAHLVSGELEPGAEIALKIDQTLTQDATGTMAYLQFERMGAERVKTELSVSYVDHNTVQVGFENADDHAYLQSVAKKYGIVFSRPGNGICHQLHLERFGKPGRTLIGSDSHTPTGGGIGMLAMGAGGLDVAVAMAGGPYYITAPRVVRVWLTGALRPGVSAKDVILAVLAKYGSSGNVGRVMEYAGPGVASLDVPSRATITNMGTELGVTTSVFPSDDETRRFLAAQGREQDWVPLAADPDADYEETFELDLAKVEPMAACPHNPGNVATIASLAGKKVNQVLVGSCTNSSYQDLACAASVARAALDAGLKPKAKLLVVPGSAQIRATLRERHADRVKENWDLLDAHGYYPNDIVKSESVARLLECAYDDWCAGVMAERLGHAEDAAFFKKRAGNWRNVLDPETGFMRGRDSKGVWRTPFSPFALGHDASRRNDFTEGNSWQWTWHVMQDPEGLIAALGGRDKALAKLLALFEQPEKTADSGFVLDATGLIGQYAHGNEPSHHVVYFFQYLGRGDRTAELVREIFDKFYLAKPDGLCGNDDCGQMSAWHVFSAMGFYPFSPCGGEYVLGAPQIASVKLKVENGKCREGNGERGTGNGEFHVIARNLSKENKYVKSVTLNGKPVEGFKLRHADIVAGGELVFEMAARP